MKERIGMTCKNKITMEVEKSTPPYFRITTVRCGWTVANGSDVGTVYCDEHKAEAETDVRCPRCGVGGFKEYMLADHYLIDCED